MRELLHPWLVTLQNSALGQTMRSAEFVYPVVEAFHILGIALLVGPAFAFDLRLLGVGRSFASVRTSARCLLPLSRVGFAIAVGTGHRAAQRADHHRRRRRGGTLEAGALIVAGLNVLIFHAGVHRSVDDWSNAPTSPMAARASALVSLFAWTGVILAGRLLAYT